MLKEIRCDKFLINGNIREPIRFQKGLNVVLGDSTGANSIGKSTLLMIIDFVFGGNDYAVKSVDVLKNVGEHEICFCFDFDGELFYFSRSPFSKNKVKKCDKNYTKLNEISLEEYKDFLHSKYRINNPEQSFRGAVGKHFRVYLRDCCDVEHPLRSSNRESDKDGIIELVKLFDKYAEIGTLIKAQKLAKDKEQVFKQAIKFKQIIVPKNKSEYFANLKEIKEKTKEIDELIEKSNNGLLEVDSIIARQVIMIKSRLSKLRRRYTLIQMELDSLCDSSKMNSCCDADYIELLKFFPNANVKKICEVENFHNTLCTALSSEYKIKKKELEDELKVLEEEINKQEEKLKEANTPPDISRVVLNTYATLFEDINKLKHANDRFDEKNNLKKEVENINKKLSNVFVSEASIIATMINESIEDYNKKIYKEEREAPVIDIKDESHYTFETPNDRGTGSRYKGLILFDLALLKLSKLPVVAHDSFMLKQIEDSVLEKLLEIYSESDKQVFIALDKAESYNERTQVILNENAVIMLSSNGFELFGKSWNKRN